MRNLLLALVAAVCIVGVAQGAEGEAPEYVALYELDVSGTYTLNVGPIEGDTTFVQSNVYFMVLPSPTADDEGLEEAEEAAAPGKFCALQRWPGSYCASIRKLQYE